MSTMAPPVMLPADDRHLDQMMQVMRAAFDPVWGEAWTDVQLAGALTMSGSFARRLLDGAERPIGFMLARAIADEAELLLVAVRPDARDRGFGRRLIESCISESRLRGCSRLFLEVRENNHAARGLYHSCGFMDVGRRPDYYTGASGERFAAMTMQHPLTRR